MNSPAKLSTRLREWLIALPDDALPVTYRDAASAMQLIPPSTIGQLTKALEVMMEEDVAAKRPMFAALVVSRQDGMPRPGFFEQAVKLGRFSSDSSTHRAAYLLEREGVMAIRQR